MNQPLVLGWCPLNGAVLKAARPGGSPLSNSSRWNCLLLTVQGVFLLAAPGRSLLFSQPAGSFLLPACTCQHSLCLHLPPRPNLTYRRSSRADMLPTRTCPPGAGQGHRGAAHQEGGTEESGTSQVIPATWEHNSLLLPSHLCCQRRPRCQPPLLVPNVSQSQPILGGNYKFMGLQAGLRPNTASFIRFSAQRICRQIKPPDSTSWLPAGCSTPEPLSATSHLLTWPRSAQACRAHGAPVQQLSPGTRGLFLFAQQPLCKVAEGQVWILTVSHPRAKHTLEA